MRRPSGDHIFIGAMAIMLLVFFIVMITALISDQDTPRYKEVEIPGYVCVGDVHANRIVDGTCKPKENQ